MIKIAFPTDDGETISRHFGQAQYYVVAQITESGVALEQRPKPHHQAHEEGHHEHSNHSKNGFGQKMLEPISDCQVLISGGMGQPAYQHAISKGLQVILSGEKDITAALEAYRTGKLESDPRRIHHRH
jgi:predicted Fe-Mo cluster-binding NifX family protein